MREKEFGHYCLRRQEHENILWFVLPAVDFSLAISIYRTAILEPPGQHWGHVREQLSLIPELNSSDCVKAAYAMKISDWNDECMEEIEVYTTCGLFR